MRDTILKIAGALLLCFCALFAAAGSTLYAEEGIHIVGPGDTLSEIAQQYGTDVATLVRLNNLNDVNHVWTGQRLRVAIETAEVAETVSTAPVTAETGSETGSERTLSYQVQPGDTLSEIAVRFHTTLPRLVELNRINPGQALFVGRQLRIPLQLHTVIAGEHIGTISALYDTTPEAIVRANNLANPSLIVPGQQLVITPPSAAERMERAIIEPVGGYHTHTDFPTTTEKWIDVDLSEQMVVAYEGTRPVRRFLVSTGLPNTPTVTGTFRIWTKTPVQDMYGGNRAAGDYYYLEDVQWVQYFYKDYAFHGTYWHTNFGYPASRGCVNMSNADAKWLFEWASPDHENAGWLFSDEENPGTLVMVHE